MEENRWKYAFNLDCSWCPAAGDSARNDYTHFRRRHLRRGHLRLSQEYGARLRIGQSDLFQQMSTALPDGLGTGTRDRTENVAQGKVWKLMRTG